MREICMSGSTGGRWKRGRRWKKPQSRGRRTGAEDDRKVGDGISLHLLGNTTWISLHRATSRPYSLRPCLRSRLNPADRLRSAPGADLSWKKDSLPDDAVQGGTDF
jgi:hypothetical protein